MTDTYIPIKDGEDASEPNAKIIGRTGVCGVSGLR